MKIYETKDIRNVVLVAHGGAGKTSLGEAILFDARVSSRLGVAGSDSSNLDYEPEEIKRGGTIQISVAHAEWQRRKINLIDTPGDQNFLVETRVAMQSAADCAVVVISCPERVQVVTEKVWQFAEELALPRILFVNKMDRERADFDACVADLRRTLSERAIPVQMPIGHEHGFEGVVDLMTMKAWRFADDGREAKATAIPKELEEAARKARDKLIEDIASSDDALLEKYLGTGELSEQEIADGLRRGIVGRTIVPVVCGAASKNIGVQPLLDLIATEFPSPDMMPAREGVDGKGNIVRRTGTPDQPFAARVFKTVGTEIGKLSMVRVLSGRLHADSTIHNATKDTLERAGSLYSLNGKRRETVSEAVAGDLVALAKLKTTKTGDTLCDDKAIFRRPDLIIPPPVIKYAIRTRSKGDEDKLGAKLHDLLDEDVALSMERDAASKDILLCGMGQSHIEATVEKLHRLGVDVELQPPKIPYLETIRGRAQHIEGKHKKQTGGKGQFGVCYLSVEPLPRGAGFEFIDDVTGGAIPRQFIPAVEKGIRDRMGRGIVAGFPVTDVRVTLSDGKYHDVDSDSRSFEIAGSKGFQVAFRQARPVLLEPVMEIEIMCPEEHMGDIMGDINARRGRILGLETKGKNQLIKAQVPMAETLKYSAELKSITGGRGTFSLAFSHYDEVPSHLADKVMSEHKVHEEEEH